MYLFYVLDERAHQIEEAHHQKKLFVSAVRPH